MAEIDDALLSSLETMEEMATKALQLNRRIKDGFMNLSEARFGSRWNKINRFSFPSEIRPTMRVVLRQNDDGATSWELLREAPPPPDRSSVSSTASSATSTASATSSFPKGMRKRVVGSSSSAVSYTHLTLPTNREV